VPLEGIAIEEEFSVGSVSFGFFTKQFFERIYVALQEKGFLEPEVMARVRGMYERYYGMVFARHRCVAEPQRAKERAIEETDRILGLMRFFHPAALEVRAHCPLGRVGSLMRHERHCFIERGDRVEKVYEGLERWGRDFGLSKAELQQLMAEGLGEVDRL
jgi:hypothetical protein